MKTLLRFLAVAGVVGVVVFLAGPSVSTEIGDAPIPIPSDLDAQLAWQETQWGDLRPGVEKTIRWVDTVAKARTPIAFVYVHGFTATRQEVAPLVDSLGARFGANVFYTRLTGHGRSPEAMREASLAAWTQDVREAVVYGSLLGERVVLIGTSTGGSLAAWAAAQPEYASAVAGLVLISPNLGPRQRAATLLDGPWGLQIARALMGDWHSWEPMNARHRRYWNTTSAVEGLPVMMATVELAESVRDRDLPFPVQLFSSSEDRVVNPAKIRAWFDDLRAERKVWMQYGEVGDHSNHVLAGDILSPDENPRVLDEITTFLEDSGIPRRTDPAADAG